MLEDGLFRRELGVLLTESGNKGDLSADRKRVFNAINGAITSGRATNAVIVAAIARAGATISAATLYDTVIPCATIIVYTPLLVYPPPRLSKWKRVRQCK